MVMVVGIEHQFRKKTANFQMFIVLLIFVSYDGNQAILIYAEPVNMLPSHLHI